MQRQETYDYNNRLQPVRIQLGTSGTPARNYCQVYNYYSGVGNPTSCVIPSQATTGNNGNVMGYFYQDSVNTSLGHTATQTFDSLNRLTNSVATGSLTHNLTFGYDRYGNMTCVVNGQTNGPCPTYSYNASNNRVTNTGFTYNAAGDVTADAVNTYSYDAEGQLTSFVSGGATVTMQYNALAQRVYRSTSTSNVSYFRDVAGQFLGGDWGGGWNADVLLGGRTLAEYSSGLSGTLYFDHPNALGSEQQWTDGAGNAGQEILFYPWGQVWQNTTKGSLFQMFDSLVWYDPETDGYQADYRYIVPRLGRWFTPDPLAGDPNNPQSLNRYTYALNNPTTLTDPLGLDSIGNSCSDPIYGTINPACGGYYKKQGPFGSWLFGNYWGGYESSCLLEGIAAPCGLINSLVVGGVAYAVGGGSGAVGGGFYWGGQTVRQCEGPADDRYCWDETIPAVYMAGPSDGAANNASADPTLDNRAKALAQAINKTGVQSLTNPCTVAGWYGASAVAAGTGVAVTNYEAIATAAAEQYPVLFNRFLTWLYRLQLRGGTVGAAIATAKAIPGQVRDACSALQ